MRKAVDSHCASSCPSPNAPMRDGRATFTMVAAIIAPTAPSARMPISPQRRAAPHRRRAHFGGSDLQRRHRAGAHLRAVRPDADMHGYPLRRSLREYACRVGVGDQGKFRGCERCQSTTRPCWPLWPSSWISTRAPMSTPRHICLLDVGFYPDVAGVMRQRDPPTRDDMLAFIRETSITPLKGLRMACCSSSTVWAQCAGSRHAPEATMPRCRVRSRLPRLPPLRPRLCLHGPRSQLHLHARPTGVRLQCSPSPGPLPPA